MIICLIIIAAGGKSKRQPRIWICRPCLPDQTNKPATIASRLIPRPRITEALCSRFGISIDSSDNCISSCPIIVTVASGCKVSDRATKVVIPKVKAIDTNQTTLAMLSAFTLFTPYILKRTPEADKIAKPIV